MYSEVFISTCISFFPLPPLYQDCAVGLLFALLPPVLGGNSGLLQGIISMGKL
jgi:hypothetical protein